MSTQLPLADMPTPEDQIRVWTGAPVHGSWKSASDEWRPVYWKGDERTSGTHSAAAEILDSAETYKA